MNTNNIYFIENFKKTFILTLLVYNLSETIGYSHFEIYSLKCNFQHPSICNDTLCVLKPIRRGVATVNLKCSLNRVLRDAWLHVEVFRKEARFQPTCINRTENVCEFFTNNRGTFLPILEKFLRKYSNIRFECPMQGMYEIRNLTFDLSTFPSLIPDATYRIDINIMDEQKTVLTFIEIGVRIRAKVRGNLKEN